MPIAGLGERRIGFELLGEAGPAVVLTPGGRYPRRVGRQLAGVLAERHRVLVYDRRNSGESSVHLGPRTESDVEADDLLALVEHLELGPVVVLGGGGGARAALLATLRRPDLVAGLALWWLIGGTFGLMTQGVRYTQSLLTAARTRGMHGVVELPELAEVMADEDNRSRTLALDADQFVEWLHGWLDCWSPANATTVPGLTRADLASIVVPAVVFEQHDDYHPSRVAAELAATLPNARLVEAPEGMGPGWFWRRAGASTTVPTDDPLAAWTSLAPAISGFVASTTSMTGGS